MSVDARTRALYDGDAAAYADYAEGGGGDAWLERFMAMLPEGGAALDLGCGSGWAAARLAASGFETAALDASPGLAAEARRRHGLAVRVGGFETLAETAAYDGIWAAFSLVHAPRAAMPGNLARIRRALRPAGALYLGLKEGTGERRDRLGRFYAYFGAEEMREMLAAAGFRDIEIARGAAKGYDGAAAPELFILARADG